MLINTIYLLLHHPLMLREASGIFLLSCKFRLVKNLNESKVQLGVSKAEVMVGVCRAAGAIHIVVAAASVGDLIDFWGFFRQPQKCKVSDPYVLLLPWVAIMPESNFPHLVFQHIIPFSHTILTTTLHAYVMVILAFSFFWRMLVSLKPLTDSFLSSKKSWAKHIMYALLWSPIQTISGEQGSLKK